MTLDQEPSWELSDDAGGRRLSRAPRRGMARRVSAQQIPKGKTIVPQIFHWQIRRIV